MTLCPHVILANSPPVSFGGGPDMNLHNVSEQLFGAPVNDVILNCTNVLNKDVTAVSEDIQVTSLMATTAQLSMFSITI